MTTTAELDERYGRVRSGPRRVLGRIAIGLLALAGISYGAWITFAAPMNSIEAADTGYSIESEHAVTVRFQMTAPAGSEIACALEAQDVEHGVVGWRVVEYEASDQNTRILTESIPTLAPATTGFVNSCWVS